MLSGSILFRFHRKNRSEEELNFYRNFYIFLYWPFFPQILNKLFRHDAEKMKDLHEQSMQMFHRRNYIRCLDCIVDYLDAMFDEFCDTMDAVQDEINGLCNPLQNSIYFNQ